MLRHRFLELLQPPIGSALNEHLPLEGLAMHHPSQLTGFEFAVMSGLRAAQLIRGCTPRLHSTHKLIVTAQMEVAAGLIGRAPDVFEPGAEPIRAL